MTGPKVSLAEAASPPPVRRRGNQPPAAKMVSDWVWKYGDSSLYDALTASQRMYDRVGS